jgi:hypothetical protein
MELRQDVKSYEKKNSVTSCNRMTVWSLDETLKVNKRTLKRLLRRMTGCPFGAWTKSQEVTIKLYVVWQLG